MKVVINNCFGGFGLSDKAIRMIMKGRGLGCYRYRLTKYDYKNGIEEYTRLEDDEESEGRLIDYLTADCGKVINKLPRDTYWYYREELKRTDKDLIEVVEKLGSEANTSCSNLVIVEIPDNVDYEITDYDGLETIHEKHRTWYVRY